MVITIIFLIISLLLLIVLVVSKNSENYIYARPRPGPYKHYWLTRHYPRWRTPLVKDYPQSIIEETCLNTCCDYEKCTQGKGCNWKSEINTWLLGTPLQCQKYNNCIEYNKFNTNPEQRHLKCLNVI